MSMDVSLTPTSREAVVTCLVRSRRPLAEGVIAVELAPVPGVNLPSWQPGAHLEVEVGPDGLVRHYSLCGDPADASAYHIAVLREPAGRGGSALIHDMWQQGAEVRVLAVRNHFAWEATAPHQVLIAGGIGITPLVPMAYAAARAGGSWELHYAGRSPDHMAFRARLADAFGPRVRLYESSAGGRLDPAEVLDASPAGTVVYVCGPASLIEAVTAAGAERGLTVRRELFAAERMTGPEPPQDAGTLGAIDSGTFEVEFARSGVTVTVEPGQSILELGEQAGADVFGSCYEGICGTCETRVLEGVPLHRDAVLDEPGDSMMICVSRASCARLVLDA